MTVLLAIATIAGIGMIVPQVVRIHRTRSLAGVSVDWIGVGLALNVWWSIYAVATELWGVLAVSIGGMALYGVMAAQTHRIDRSGVPRVGRASMLTASLMLAALVIGGWTGAGVAIGLAYAVQFSPATITAIRSTRLDGLSLSTWVLAAVEALIWLLYGAIEVDPALIIGGAGGAICSTLIVVRIVSSGRPGPEPMPAAGHDPLRPAGV